MTDGKFIVTGCHNGHVSLEVHDADGVVQLVSTMTMEEAKDLADDLDMVVDSILEAQALEKRANAP